MSLYLLVNISCIVCNLTLFKITWSIYMAFLHWKNYKKHERFLNTTFEIKWFLFLNTNLVISHIIRWGFQKTLYPVNTFIPSSLVSLFNLMLSKYVIKILAECLASSWAGWKYEYCVKSRFFILTPVATFFNKLCSCMHAKQVINYFAVFESFFL